MAGTLKELKIVPKKRSKETNPLKIFESPTLRGTIENIWEPQSEALKAMGCCSGKTGRRCGNEHRRRENPYRSSDLPIHHQRNFRQGCFRPASVRIVPWPLREARTEAAVPATLVNEFIVLALCSNESSGTATNRVDCDMHWRTPPESMSASHVMTSFSALQCTKR
ncbi:MAG: hypothetical protein IT165_23370 [Bryobacterales bacterium]|nr:hypothetical protein [Bryobacterales bacterium]